MPASPAQSRIFAQVSEKDASRIIDILEPVFEAEGYALTTMEIDEDADLWEASIYVPSDAVDAVRKNAAAALSEAYPKLALATEILPDIDWVAKSLEGLQPVRAGRFLVHGSHDRHRIRPSDIGIEIEASQAFGTGHHGTTAGCLEMIGKVLRARKPANALDLGTGSGVLAIAVRKLAPVRVLATDIDPVATTVARQNARINGVARAIDFATAPGFHAAIFRQRGRFDLIVANILARPLMQMAPQMNAHLAQGGTVILSGILAVQRRKVLAAYATQGLFHRETLWRNGWVTIRLSRRHP